MKRVFQVLIVGFVAFFIMSSFVFAAELYFSSPTINVCQGDTIALQLLLDSPSEAINAGQVYLSFNPLIVQVDSINWSTSLFDFFPEKPEWDNSTGTIRMIGGLPTPGFQGTGGLVAELTISVNELGNPNFQYDTTTDILLDDGLGTSTFLTLNNTVISVLPRTDSACTAPVSISGNLSILEGSTSILTASGGDGFYTWSAPFSSPESGTGSSFSIFYISAGSYQVIVTDGDGKTAQATIVASVPTASPTPIECPILQLQSETGDSKDLRRCEVKVECLSADSDTFNVLLNLNDSIECPIVMRCQADFELLDVLDEKASTSVVDRKVTINILQAPVKTFVSIVRRLNDVQFLIGLVFGWLILLVLYLLFRAIRALYYRLFDRKEYEERNSDNSNKQA